MGNFTLSEFWKNFQLGTELRISGNFIYNGIFFFDTMQHFCYEDEIFEVLYNISVGVERLQKVTIILLEHNDKIDQSEFEKNLITHSHIELYDRIKKHRKQNFGKQHVEFLSMLSNFYKSTRYEKYNLNSVYKFIEGRSEFINYIEKYLNLKISVEFFGCTPNSNNIKKFFGNIIGKICSNYFDIINDECHRLNIYTDDLPSDSKASKIFWGKSFNFFEERQVQKEIIKYLIQSDLPSGISNFLKEEPPLNLEFHDTNYYINYLIDFHKSGGVIEEVEELYTEIGNISDRTKHLEIVGDSDISLEFDDDENDE